MEEEKQIPIQGSEEKLKAEEESFKETIIHKSAEVINSEKHEEEELVDSVVKSVDEVSTPLPADLTPAATDLVENSIVVDAVKHKTEETEEKAEQILEEINGFAKYSNGVEEETPLPDPFKEDPADKSVVPDIINLETGVKIEETEERDVQVTEVKTQETDERADKTEEIAEKIVQIAEEEERTLLDSDAKVGESGEVKVPGKENVEVKLQANDNIEGSSSRVIDLAEKENFDDSKHEKAEETSNVVERSKEVEISESIGNPPIISVTSRTIQPTSWRSCCGLFEVLRRSER